MKILKTIFFATILLSIINCENIKRCQTVLDAFRTQANDLVETYQAGNFTQTVLQGVILQKHLPQLELQCAVMYDKEEKVKYVAPFDCQQTTSKIAEILISGDIVSDYQVIREIIDFQVDQCLPYDFKGGKQGGFKQIMQKFMQNLEISESGLASLPMLGESNGGKCLACGLLVTALENYINLYDIDIADFIGKKGICRIFYGKLERWCDNLFEVIGPKLLQDLLANKNSDYICNDMNFCEGFSECKLHPQEDDGEQKKQQQLSAMEKYAYQTAVSEALGSNILKDLIKKFADDHLPLLDWDKDRFTQTSYLRGYDWRGYDCSQYNPLIYPGREKKTGKKGIDYNCNGISGVDPDTGAPYKDLYCRNSGQLGTVVMGDSAGAHFSLPARWFNASYFNDHGNFKDVIPRILDEGDLPHKSAGTGWLDEPDVNSFYKKLVEKNECNRNDYQNLGVNGQRSKNAMGNIIALARDQQKDFPVMIFWELIGNDVCSSRSSPESMTSPEEFRTNILALWNKVDSMVPAGSHMVVTGVADGTILYNCLQNREDPLGIPYPVFYDYMNCLHKSPCAGWMNSDLATRKATTQRAKELNQVYQEIIASTTFQNFDIQYYDFPMEQIIDIVVQNGGECHDAIEPMDGFHPSQVSEALWADILWKNLERDQPAWLGNVNHNNENIKKQFGTHYVRFEQDVDFEEYLEDIIELQ